MGCFPVMGVILRENKDTEFEHELFSHYGGYSNSFETRMLKDGIVSLLWGGYS